MMLKVNISKLLHPGENLFQRAVISSFWVFLLRAVQQIFGLARLMILARILAPQDFGLMGIALLLMATLETFTQSGFQQALIQKKRDINSYLDSAWTVSILRSFFIFTILYLIAPFAATLFDSPEAKPIIQIIGISMILQAFTNIGVIYFQKELEFNKQFVYQLGGTLTDFIVAITAALILRNVWSIVFGLLAGNVVMLVTSYLIHPYRPHLSFDIVKAKELFGYGKWISGSTILVFLVMQGDDFFVGTLLGATALGFYQMAYRLSNLPTTEITHVISQVTFPVYSKIQDDIPKLREAYLRVLQFTALISFPLAGLIFVLAPDFTKIFFGEKWMPMVPAMQVLSIWGGLRSVAVFGPLVQAIGKPKIGLQVPLIQLIVIAIFIYPFSVRWGILGTSVAVLFSSFVARGISSYLIINIIDCKAKIFYKTTTLPLISTLLMVLSMDYLKKYIVIGQLEFFLCIGYAIISYVFALYLFDKFLSFGTKSFYKESLSYFLEGIR